MEPGRSRVRQGRSKVGVRLEQGWSRAGARLEQDWSKIGAGLEPGRSKIGAASGARTQGEDLRKGRGGFKIGKGVALK